MSRIGGLLKEKCSNGVEYRSIGSMITRVRTKGKTCKDITQVYVVSNTKGIVRSEDYHDNEVHSDDTSNYTVIKQGMFAYNPSRLNIGSLGVLEKKETGLVSPMYVVFSIDEKVILQKYLLLNLKSSAVKNRIDSLKEEGARFRFDYARWDKIEIPVPPIEIQQEIVRILDKFTDLEAELQAELDSRKKQYEFAMDSLVANRIDVVDISVGEAFDIITDYTAAGSFADLAKNVVYNDSPDYAQLVRTMDIKSKFTKGSPVYVSESAFKYLWRVNLDSEAVILPNIGANCGEVYFVVPNDLPHENNVLGPNAILLRSTKHNNRYLAYTLQTSEFQRQLRKIISPAGQTKFNKTDLKKLKIKVPSIEEQEKMVELLDKFDTICNDLDYGLPAEIAARHKQYEYYRDKLLTFMRKEV